MKRTGTIVRFDTARGFGFLHSPQSPADVFFHVRDFNPAAGPPVVGMVVAFEEIHMGGKGPRAMAVRPADRPPRPAAPRRGAAAPAQRRAVATRAAARSGGQPTRPTRPTASLALFLLLLAWELGLLGWCFAQGRLPLIVLVLGALLNLATFWVYWHDKHAARRQAWRVREATLHLLALAGGWPAAWWAQQLLRHKSRKPAFRATGAATIGAHLVLLAAFSSWPLLA